MAGLTTLLKWQWRAYWRRILRGGTAARSNLVVLGLISVAGLARYITFLRGISGPMLPLLFVGLLFLCFQPGWDAAKLPLGPRDMARFPLSSLTRIGLRILSRFIAPTNWILTIACVLGVWPFLKLAHPATAVTTLVLFMGSAFTTGLALVDFAGTARGSRIAPFLWAAPVAAAGVAWFLGVRTVSAFPPLPLALLCGLLCALVGCVAAFRSLPWMLRHSPPEERSGQQKSAPRMTLLRRELRLHSKYTEVRTAWFISAALCVYLATADRPEPDALRVMLGILAFLTMAAAMNSFGIDGVSGLDRFLLWPVNIARVVANKNQAFALTIAGPAVPLAILAAWRFGWREGTADLFEAAAIVLAVLAWGNITSVRHPESENLLDQLIGMAAVAVPTAAAIGLLRNQTPLYVPAATAMFALAYAFSLNWSARYIARNYEQMRSSLS